VPWLELAVEDEELDWTELDTIELTDELTLLDAIELDAGVELRGGVSDPPPPPPAPQATNKLLKRLMIRNLFLMLGVSYDYAVKYHIRVIN